MSNKTYKIYKLSKTNIFFSHFEGTRGEKTPNISHLGLIPVKVTNAISNAGKIKKGQPLDFSFGKCFGDFHQLLVERYLKLRWGIV